MSSHSLLLYVASYPDDVNAIAATADLEALETLKDVNVRATVVATRNGYGDVEVKEHDSRRGRRDLGLGAAGGLAVGLFSPALLLMTTLGAAVGGGLHELVQQHDEKKLREDLKRFLSRGSAAIMAIVDDHHAGHLDTAFTRAHKKASKIVDWGSYESLAKVLSSAGYDVQAALVS